MKRIGIQAEAPAHEQQHYEHSSQQRRIYQHAHWAHVLAYYSDRLKYQHAAIYIAAVVGYRHARRQSIAYALYCKGLAFYRISGDYFIHSIGQRRIYFLLIIAIRHISGKYYFLVLTEYQSSGIRCFHI